MWDKAHHYLVTRQISKNVCATRPTNNLSTILVTHFYLVMLQYSHRTGRPVGHPGIPQRTVSAPIPAHLELCLAVLALTTELYNSEVSSSRWPPSYIYCSSWQLSSHFMLIPSPSPTTSWNFQDPSGPSRTCVPHQGTSGTLWTHPGPQDSHTPFLYHGPSVPQDQQPEKTQLSGIQTSSEWLHQPGLQ